MLDLHGQPNFTTGPVPTRDRPGCFARSARSAEPACEVVEQPERPLDATEPVGNLFERHAAAGIQSHVLPKIHAFFDAVVASALRSGGIRLGAALPR